MCQPRPEIAEAVLLTLLVCLSALADEPPALNPFAPREVTREDAIRGFVELSDGHVQPGLVYLTRDVRLKIYDETVQRQREVPLSVIKRIDCAVQKEWLEKEWRFKENASDVKVYTGRTYPAREYVHTITLKDDRKITGPLAGIVYVQSENGGQPNRFLIHKRQKGPTNSDLQALIFLRSVQLGDDAYQEGLRRAEEQRAQKLIKQ